MIRRFPRFPLFQSFVPVSTSIPLRLFARLAVFVLPVLLVGYSACSRKTNSSDTTAATTASSATTAPSKTATPAGTPSAPTPIPPAVYLPKEGDILFQSLPHSALVDAIEGATKSCYSHCGIVAHHNGTWTVIEALEPVRETPFAEWTTQGRDGTFAVYRLNAQLSAKIPEILAQARKFLGRPYDIRYRFDDEYIYCSELIFKAVKNATGVELGKVQKLGELDWGPHLSLICALEGGLPPLSREMISPRALSEAKELTKIKNNNQ
jgi:cell wall-associated NlpC family hydrolase